MGAVATINNARDSITNMSDQDVQSLFGYSRTQILSSLDTSSIRANTSLMELRAVVTDRANNLVSIVDSGLERSIAPLLNSATLSSRYATVLQSEIDQSRSSSGVEASRVEPASSEKVSTATEGESVASRTETRPLPSGPFQTPTLNGSGTPVARFGMVSFCVEKPIIPA